MIEIIYYTQKGEVKSLELLLNDKTGFYECTPQENYFIKALGVKNNFVNEWLQFEVLKSVLSVFEQHYLNVRYYYFCELSPYMFKNENEIIQLHPKFINNYIRFE